MYKYLIATIIEAMAEAKKLGVDSTLFRLDVVQELILADILGHRLALCGLTTASTLTDNIPAAVGYLICEDKKDVVVRVNFGMPLNELEKSIKQNTVYYFAVFKGIILIRLYSIMPNSLFDELIKQAKASKYSKPSFFLSESWAADNGTEIKIYE